MKRRKDAALTIFAQSGYAGTSMDAIAAGAGISKPTLHQYFMWRYVNTILRPDLLSLARLIIGEAQRFPEIGRAYQASGPDRVLEGIMCYLSTQRDAGRLNFEDDELAVQDLWGLVLSAPRTRALYEPDTPPTKAECARYNDSGLTVFLKAYSTSLTQDLDALDTVKRLP